jgi:hypothetical protein
MLYSPLERSFVDLPLLEPPLPAEIVGLGVWLYFRFFCLSYRAVEELLFARGIIVMYEAIRKWCQKFGQAYANQLRHRWPQRQRPTSLAGYQIDLEPSSRGI